MKIGKSVKIKYSDPKKGTSLAQNTSTKPRLVTIHPPLRLVGEPKKTKKEMKEEKDTQNSGKPDHPRRRIKIKLCMVGGLRYVVGIQIG